MIPELGTLSLIIAFCFALLQASIPLVGVYKNQVAWQSLTRPLAIGQFFFIAASFLLLIYSFVVNDFTVRYVVSHSAESLPLIYRIGATWGGHEGSLLLWLIMQNTWFLALAIYSRRLPMSFNVRLFTVVGFVNAGFLLFLLSTSNPFTRLFTLEVVHGQDLNPILQDPGLLIHPPMLYMGYVGFAVGFAFAVAALLEGQVQRQWAAWLRPWAIGAWLCLTLGIVLGSWWAYHELGWGGWWYWDPVENASILPWLVSTALIHSLIVTEKRGALKGWSILLAILTFALSLLGTFLVRSGVLVSVHAFASDPARGSFLLKYLVLVIAGSLVLFGIRNERFKQEQGFGVLSRESLILGNNLLLFTAMGTILLGTLYPLVLEVFGIAKISVGMPYFNAVFVPLAIPLFILMGLGPNFNWSQTSKDIFKSKLLWVAIFSVLSGIATPLILGKFNIWVCIGIASSIWVFLGTILSIQKILKTRRINQLTGSQWGMLVAHIGVACTILGVTIVSQYSVERDVRIAIGETVDIAGYQLEFSGTRPVSGPNYHGLAADFAVQKGKQNFTLTGEKRIYTVNRQAMTEAGIKAGLFRDLYLALGEQLPDAAWSVRIYYKPFVRWIWLGGLLMLIGALLTLWFRVKPGRKNV